MDESANGERDWRLDLGPENLFDVTLVKKRYRAWSESWEHDHCVYCTAKFMDPQFSNSHKLLIEQNSEVLTIGFVVKADGSAGNTRDDYLWVCGTCTEDFRERFRWAIVASEPLPESAMKPSTDS